MRTKPTGSSSRRSRSNEHHPLPPRGEDDTDPFDAKADGDCTLAAMRALTRPPIAPPTVEELERDDFLLKPWWEGDERGQGHVDSDGAVVVGRIPVDPQRDCATQHHWRAQKRTELFERMFDWRTDDHDDHGDDPDQGRRPRPYVTLHPYFSFGDPHDPFQSCFFAPWEDVGNGLRHLLFHQIESRHTLHRDVTLSSHGTDMFVATAPAVSESELLCSSGSVHDHHLRVSKSYYTLRCHYDNADPDRRKLIFGYHARVADRRGDCRVATKDNNSSSSSGPSHSQGPAASSSPLSSPPSSPRVYFGYNTRNDPVVSPFRPLHVIEIDHNDDWRLQTCIVMRNVARILNCMKDYAIPLESNPDKLSLVRVPVPGNMSHGNMGSATSVRIQKRYDTPYICNVTKNATVANMVRIYRALQDANIPHTDRLVSCIEVPNTGHNHHHGNDDTNDDDDDDNMIGPPPMPTMAPSTATTSPVVVCQFAPVGRSYLPLNVDELLDALVCVSEALVALHALNIMHRDIRWSNVFHAFDDAAASDGDGDLRAGARFSREWVLFDFEFAARAPQPAFPAHSLTPGNHAPEMVAPSPVFADRGNRGDAAAATGGGAPQQHHQPNGGAKAPTKATAAAASAATNNGNRPYYGPPLSPKENAPSMSIDEEPPALYHEEEMREGPTRYHDTAVDIWGLGYMIQHANVDAPASHAGDLRELQADCLRPDPADRPTALECHRRLAALQSRPRSREKDLVRL